MTLFVSETMCWNFSIELPPKEIDLDGIRLARIYFFLFGLWLIASFCSNIIIEFFLVFLKPSFDLGVGAESSVSGALLNVYDPLIVVARFPTENTREWSASEITHHALNVVSTQSICALHNTRYLSLCKKD